MGRMMDRKQTQKWETEKWGKVKSEMKNERYIITSERGV